MRLGSKKGTKVMRLTKGSKVEVFCTTKTIPSGFWRPGQIVCGNGRTYSVQFESAPSSRQSTTNVENVLRKVIRPCPPVKDKPVKWVPGDVVEVFVHGIWKVGKITGVAYGNNFYFVVMAGHARELSVKLCNLRRLQMWENNKWTFIKKVINFYFVILIFLISFSSKHSTFTWFLIYFTIL